MLRAEEPFETPALDSLLLRFRMYSAWRSPEKVYLHFDRSCYTAGETVWFKGWVKDASVHSALPPSNFLYAEVLDERGEATVRVKIKRSGDGFPGCLELPDNLETGNYTVRAYTLWQLNGGSEYLFNDSIRIIGEKGKKEKARRQPPEDLKISFWPEGGRYFAGHYSAIGFKVTDKTGQSLDFSGYLVDDAGGSVKPVLTVHDGMGAFSFTPLPGRSYSLQDVSGKLYPLPPPSADGATLQMRIRSGRYYLSALGHGGGEASLLVRDASELRPLASIVMDGNMGTMVMEKSFFRSGINHFLLVDSGGRILAERLFFVRDTLSPVCTLKMDQFASYPRSLVRGVISLSAPDGTPLDGNCSVSVTRGALKSWQQSDGITSYMGLSSELKGRINDPYYYFDPDVPEQERNTALDVLMMIQGWRYYNLEKIADIKGGDFKIKYVRELMQELRGKVTRLLSSRMPKKFTFTFLVPKLSILHSLDVKKGREFIIDNMDFPENTGMLINIGTSRLGANYLPKWDGDPAAEPYLYKPAPGMAKGERIDVPILNVSSSDDTLQAAVVTASYADDDVLVFGRNYREDLAVFKDMTLVEYLSMKKAMFEYDGENMYNRHRRRTSSETGEDADNPDSFDTGEDDESGRVKLIVEDNEEAWWSYDMIQLGDLRSLSVSTQADPLYGGDGGVVRISVKPGSMNRSRDRNPSLLYFVPLGYQLPRYFESPRYDRGDPGSFDRRNTLWWSPDVAVSGGRATIEFCNNDLMDYPYIVRVEGLSSDGRPFSRHCIISPE